MVRTIVASLAMVLFSGFARAEAPAADASAGKMDMSKMGPWTRKPKDEKKVKKDIADLYKQSEAMEKKGDHEAMLAMIDFPVYMGTDDSKGAPTAEEWNQEKYISVMKPFWEHAPKDSKMTHKLTINVLSDSLANVVDDFTMTGGGHKMAGRNMCLLVKKDGQWKWKSMVEAGWGDSMTPPGATATTPPPATPTQAAAAPAK
jgi:hypothetical protein